MNKTILYTILTHFVVSISGGCRHDVTCELANYAGWDREARQEMHDEIIHSDLSNADKGNAMLGLASRYAETALGLSDTIAQLLPARERLLYESERQAYGQWREWQETISLDLIGDIWDLWYGGSALGSFQTMHIYQIEDQNLEDNLALFRLLCGSPAHKVIEEEVSLSQVKEEADKLLLDVTDKEYHERMAEMIMKDLNLLQNWIAARDAFSKNLPLKKRKEYEKQTNSRLQLCRAQYGCGFCYEAR